jgi:hypothetical protein
LFRSVCRCFLPRNCHCFDARFGSCRWAYGCLVGSW